MALESPFKESSIDLKHLRLYSGYSGVYIVLGNLLWFFSMSTYSRFLYIISGVFGQFSTRKIALPTVAPKENCPLENLPGE